MAFKTNQPKPWLVTTGHLFGKLANKGEISQAFSCLSFTHRTSEQPDV